MPITTGPMPSSRTRDVAVSSFSSVVVVVDDATGGDVVVNAARSFSFSPSLPAA